MDTCVFTSINTGHFETCITNPIDFRVNSVRSTPTNNIRCKFNDCDVKVTKLACVDADGSSYCAKHYRIVCVDRKWNIRLSRCVNRFLDAYSFKGVKSQIDHAFLINHLGIDPILVKYHYIDRPRSAGITPSVVPHVPSVPSVIPYVPMQNATREILSVALNTVPTNTADKINLKRTYSEIDLNADSDNE